MIFQLDNFLMVKVKTNEITKLREQFEDTKKAIEHSSDEIKLYTICKKYTNFVEKVARQHRTTVNGMQMKIELA